MPPDAPRLVETHPDFSRLDEVEGPTPREVEASLVEGQTWMVRREPRDLAYERPLYYAVLIRRPPAWWGLQRPFVRSALEWGDFTRGYFWVEHSMRLARQDAMVDVRLWSANLFQQYARHPAMKRRWQALSFLYVLGYAPINQWQSTR